MLGLPFVEEFMYVGVHEELWSTSCCGFEAKRKSRYISCQPHEGRQLKINDLRKDLRWQLAGYKLPTLPRVLGSEFPKMACGMVQKKALGPYLFPCPSWESVPEIQTWRNPKVEVMAKLRNYRGQNERCNLRV